MEGRQGIGSSKKNWVDVIRGDMRECEVNGRMAMVRYWWIDVWMDIWGVKKLD